MVVAWTMTLVDCGVTWTDLDCVMVWDIRERERKRAERSGTVVMLQERGNLPGGGLYGRTGNLLLSGMPRGVGQLRVLPRGHSFSRAPQPWHGLVSSQNGAWHKMGGGLRVLLRGHSFSRGAAVWT